jgi:cytochrome c oxidase subunit 2
MKKLTVLATAVVLVMVLAACGSNGGATNNTAADNSAGGTNTGVTDTGSASNEVVIKATDFQFDKQEYKVAKGDVTFKLETAGVHGVEIENTDVKLQAGDSKTVSLTEPGTYTIRCDVPCGVGHAQMVSKLIVE